MIYGAPCRPGYPVVSFFAPCITPLQGMRVGAKKGYPYYPSRNTKYISHPSARSYAASPNIMKIKRSVRRLLNHHPFSITHYQSSIINHPSSIINCIKPRMGSTSITIGETYGGEIYHKIPTLQGVECINQNINVLAPILHLHQKCIKRRRC